MVQGVQVAIALVQGGAKVIRVLVCVGYGQRSRWKHGSWPEFEVWWQFYVPRCNFGVWNSTSIWALHGGIGMQAIAS